MADTPNTDQPMTVEAATARRAEMVADPAFVERYLSGGIPERDEMLKVSTALSIDPANSAQSFQTEQQISTLKNIADLSDDHIAEIRSGRAVTRGAHLRREPEISAHAGQKLHPKISRWRPGSSN